MRNDCTLKYPALAKLQLGTEDIAVLYQQGTVSSEMRRGRLLYRLRFRRGGRQYARYIGFDGQQAELVRQELTLLQEQSRRRVQLRELAQAARESLRKARRQLAPLLPAGYRFHGHAVRKRRRPTVC